jgi:hypothetical protein
MTKAIIINGLTLVGSLMFILVAGAVIGYWMGLTPHFAASVIVGIQMGVAGWIAGSWFR